MKSLYRPAISSLSSTLSFSLYLYDPLKAVSIIRAEGSLLLDERKRLKPLSLSKQSEGGLSLSLSLYKSLKAVLIEELIENITVDERRRDLPMVERTREHL